MPSFRPAAAALVLAFVLEAGPAGALQKLTLGSATALQGESVAISLGYVGDGSVVGLQVDIAFDTDVLDAPTAAGGAALGGHLLRSSEVSPGLFRIVVYSPGNAALADGAFAQLSFTVDNAAPSGQSPVTFSAVTLGNAAAVRLTPTSLTPGSVNVREAGSYYTVIPCRAVDTRDLQGPYGGPILTSGVPRRFTLEGKCGIPSTAKSVAVNITVVSPTAGGYLTLYPGGQTPPQTSTINFGGNQIRANNAILLLSADGEINVLATLFGGGRVHLIVDVSGYFD